MNERTPAELKIAAALAPFGWTCTDEFWRRYYSDAWVFNLANTAEALSTHLTEVLDGTEQTWRFIPGTDPMTAHDDEKAVPLDEDLLLATVDLVGRSGAKNFEIGWLNDPGEPAYELHGAQWWIKAQYKGTRIITENHPGPAEACDAFGQQILKGAKCKCGKLVALSSSGAFAYNETLMADGSTWTGERARKAGQCRWTRRGPRWKRACE